MRHTGPDLLGLSSSHFDPHRKWIVHRSSRNNADLCSAARSGPHFHSRFHCFIKALGGILTRRRLNLTNQEGLGRAQALSNDRPYTLGQSSYSIETSCPV